MRDDACAAFQNHIGVGLVLEGRSVGGAGVVTVQIDSELDEIEEWAATVVVIETHEAGELGSVLANGEVRVFVGIARSFTSVNRCCN